MNQIPQNLFDQGHGAPMHVLILVAIVAAVSFLLAVPAYRCCTGLTYGQSVKIWACAIGLTFTSLIFISTEPTYGHMNPSIKIPMCNILLFLIATPFGVQLYRKGIGGQLTDAEKLPGMDGVRAWLSVGNLICAVLISICAWQVFQVPPPAMFALTIGLLLAYPLLNMASPAAQSSSVAPPEDLSGEREKVLQLLEAGKINAEESAELLNALGQSVPSRPPPASEIELTPQRKIVLLGAALLLMGFFLPWFKVNLGQAMNAAAGQVQQMTGALMPGNEMPQMNIPQSNGLVQVVQAGNIPHGLGWWILALGIGAAVLPFFATTLKAQMQKKVILAALAVGAFLLVYLLSDSLRYVSIGLILALAGYALEIVGTLKERPVAR